jgi:chromosome segregation ATPase
MSLYVELLQERKKTILRCDSRNMNGMMQTYRYGIRKELLRAVRAQNLKGMKKCILEMENLLQQAEKRLTYQEEDLALEREKKVLLEKRVEEGDKQIENLQEQVTKLITLLRTKEKDRMVCLRKLEELNSYVCDMEKQYRISLTELQEAHEKDKKKLQTTTKLLQNVTTCQEMYEKENRILKNKIIKYESQMSCGDIILSQRAALLQELTTRMERKLAYIEVLETQKDAYQKLVSSLNDTFSKTSYWPREVILKCFMW